MRDELDPSGFSPPSGVPGRRPRPPPRSGPEPHPALRTRLCDLVGVRYPIVQTGMGWVAGPGLVAATAEAGALGILASATMTLEELVRPVGGAVAD